MSSVCILFSACMHGVARGRRRPRRGQQPGEGRSAALTNLAFAYPTLIEGSVHDRAGTLAMLLTDVSLAVIGFGVLMLAIRVLRPGIHALAEAVETGKTA
jgi:hypothetical protein